MHKIHTCAALALSTILTAGAISTAYAAPEGNRAGPGDAGTHGMKIADIEARAKAMFDKVDTNHDGSVSRAEFDAAPPPPHMQRGMRGRGAMGDMGPMHHMMPMDGDHPPPPDADEAANPDGAGPNAPGRFMHRPDPKVELPALFTRLDANKDGKLTTAEFMKLPDARRAQMRDHMFKALDKDGNGSLSPTEFPPFVAYLKALDKNGDGVVTRDEMPRHGWGMHRPGGAAADGKRDAPNGAGGPE